MKHCTNCGLQIAQEVTTCPRCGASMPYTTKPLPTSSSSIEPTSTAPATPKMPESQGAQLDFSPQQSSFPAQASYREYPASSMTNQRGGTDPALPAIPSEPRTQQIAGMGSTPPQTPLYAPQSQPPLFLTPPPPPAQNRAFYENPMLAGQAPPYGPSFPPPQTPFPAQRQTRRSLSRGLIALVIVLALLLMLGGASLIYYSAVARPAQLHAQATATMQTQLTASAHGTAIANTQATGTAVTNANATATVQAQATTQAQATVTALQNIYTQATKGAPATTSPLAAQDNNNWDVNDAVGGGGCGFNAGTYHATIQSKNFYFTCFAQATNFSNFAFQVQMTINQGDAGGLVFRSNSNRDLAQFYLFSIDQKGGYRLDVSKDQTHSMPIAEDTTSTIKTGLGQLNTLTVIAKGSTIYFYINKQYVGSATDNTYSSGMLGVFAADDTANTDVSFSNAQVWAL